LAKQFPGTVAVSCDITNEDAIEKLVSEHDVAIRYVRKTRLCTLINVFSSLIPYIYHAKVIKAAVKHKKHVVTTSYVSPAMMEYDQA
jgi:saccharopine dehydrogenase (NADP+, L-glutamate forming)